MKKDCKINNNDRKGEAKAPGLCSKFQKEITGLINAIPNFIKTGLLCWETPFWAELGAPKTIRVHGMQSHSHIPLKY